MVTLGYTSSLRTSQWYLEWKLHLGVCPPSKQGTEMLMLFYQSVIAKSHAQGDVILDTWELCE